MRGAAREYEAFYESQAVAAARYRPSTPFDGHIVVLRAGASEEQHGPRCTTGTVTVVPVPGDHLSVLRRLRCTRWVVDSPSTCAESHALAVDGGYSSPDTRLQPLEAPMAVDPIPTNYPRVSPYLCCRGAADAIEFYKDVLRRDRAHAHAR